MQIYIKYRKDGELHEDTLRISNIELDGHNVVLVHYDIQDAKIFNTIEFDVEDIIEIMPLHRGRVASISVGIILLGPVIFGYLVSTKPSEPAGKMAIIAISIWFVFCLLWMVLLYAENKLDLAIEKIKQKPQADKCNQTWMMSNFLNLRMLKGVYSDFGEAIRGQLCLHSREFGTNELLWGKNIDIPYFIDLYQKVEKEADEYYKTIIRKHFKTLKMKEEQTTFQDDYGEWNVDGFYKEMRYFVINVIKNHYGTSRWFSEDNAYVSYFIDLFCEVEKEFKEKENTPVLQEISNLKEQIETGVDYENYVKTILERSGYSVKTTPKTGDQGVDLIVDNDGKRTAVQCKFYSKPVGNKAVQEVAAGSKYYKCDEAVVISNQSYTPSARQLAKNLGVVLLNDSNLSSVFSDVITGNDFLDEHNETDEDEDEESDTQEDDSDLDLIENDIIDL